MSDTGQTDKPSDTLDVIIAGTRTTWSHMADGTVTCESYTWSRALDRWVLVESFTARKY